MQTFSLLIAFLCTLGVESKHPIHTFAGQLEKLLSQADYQPSYYALRSTNWLPKDSVCGQLYGENTYIMVPNPQQTHEYRRVIPTDPLDLLDLIGKSRNDSERDLAPLSYPDRCSDKILTLICFFYFPITGFNIKEELLPPVFPCRSLCEEVTANGSECSKRIRSHWGNFYKYCNYTYFSGGDASNKDGGFRPVYEENSYCTTGPCPDQIAKGIDKTKRCKTKRPKVFYKIPSPLLQTSTYALNCTITSLELDGNWTFSKRAIKCRVNSFFALKENDTCGDSLTAGSEVYVLGYSVTCKHSAVLQVSRRYRIGDKVCIVGNGCIEHCGKKYLFISHRDTVSNGSCPTFDNVH